MILLDSDAITHLSYGNEKLRRKIEAVSDEILAVPIIARNELLRGRAENLLKASNEEELRKAAERFQKTEEMLSDFVVAGFDENSIEHFGRLRKQKNLKKIGRADVLIACIALAHDAILVTRNTKDFKEIARLRVENWID